MPFKILILLNLCLYNFYASSFKIDNITLFAENLEYNKSKDIFQANGKALIFDDKYALYADNIICDKKYKYLDATGYVVIRDNPGNIITTNKVLFDQNSNYLIAENLFIQMQNQVSTLDATKAEVDIAADKYFFKNVCYTACSRSEFQDPIWQIRAGTLEIDQINQITHSKDLYFDVFGVPIFYLPYLKYSLPDAEAKSGLLMPSFEDGSLKIPIYFNVKPNLDITLAPKLYTDSNIILEYQIRHLLKQGEYIFDGSSMVHNVLPNQKLNYHLFGSGKFKFYDMDVGLKIKSASNGCYLRKYYNIFDPYLESEGFIYSVKGSNYTRFSGLYFQDMRYDDQGNVIDGSFAIPELEINKVFNLKHDIELHINFMSLFYKFCSFYDVFRISNIVHLQKSFEIENNFFKISLYNKINLYTYNIDHQFNDKNDPNFRKALTQLHVDWRYPIVFSNTIFEPIILGCFDIVGNKHNPNILIDSEKMFELNDTNLISYNRYSGRDKDEVGTRINYGINTSTITQEASYGIFIGSMYTKKEKNNIIVSLMFDREKFKTFYRLHLNHDLKIHMQEISTQYVGDKLKFLVDLFQMDADAEFKQKACNLTYKIKYDITQSWSIDWGSTLNLVEKLQLLFNSIGVTYNYDCVRMYLGVSYSSKNYNKRLFSIGLKTFNM